MSYGSAYPCSRAVLSASLHIELPPCSLPAAGAAWPRHRSYVLAREDHARYPVGRDALVVKGMTTSEKGKPQS